MLALITILSYVPETHRVAVSMTVMFLFSVLIFEQLASTSHCYLGQINEANCSCHIYHIYVLL